MNSELIMKSDVLDILFEKRNKAYGAYMLRKFYNKRLIKSIGIMTATVMLFSAFTFLPGKSGKSPDFIVTEPGFGKIPSAPKLPEVKPVVKQQVKISPKSSLKLVSSFIFVNKKDSADVLHDLKNMAIGSQTNIILSEQGTEFIAVSGSGTGDITEPVNITAPPIDITKPLDIAEIMPEYPGGMVALRKFLLKNLDNPRELETGELISVKVKFVVGYDGKLQRFELIQDGGTEFNNEVIRVLKKMPAWIPGKSKGQNVSVYYTIPVKFIAEG
ncbi:MAG: energy transducer TonB [Ferruginibacter sp.]|nr:energy transducer TonB [Ferruginibacter sp.]